MPHCAAYSACPTSRCTGRGKALRSFREDPTHHTGRGSNSIPVYVFQYTSVSPWFSRRAYRRRGGSRTSPLPDFYIGAHAAIGRLALLTRDAARYRSYYPKVEILAPTKRGL